MVEPHVANVDVASSNLVSRSIIINQRRIFLNAHSYVDTHKIMNTVFLHIPKTGGTSLQFRLAEINKAIAKKKGSGYPDASDGRANLYIKREVTNFLEKYEETYIKDTGGPHYWVHQILEKMGTTNGCFTFLREPLSHRHSVIQAINHDNRPHEHVELKIFKEGYNSYLSKSFEMNNPFCHRIGAETSKMYNSQALNLSGHRPGPAEVTQEIFERAISRLENFFYIGCFENYASDVEDLIHQLCELYDVTIPPKKEHRNKHNYKDLGINEFINDELIQRNQYDIKLYEYCKKHFF